jgi:glycosyltransferase involved in cell wall biosynthesis
VLQRLEAEKDTRTALAAWRASELGGEGWSLSVVGAGSERSELEGWVASENVAGVSFGGWTDDVVGELGRAGILLASAPAEPLGLSVLNAMAAGVPVAAAASGGHLETVGLLEEAPLFAPGDVGAAAGVLRELRSEALRARLSRAGRELIGERFTLEEYVDRLLHEYDIVRGAPPSSSSEPVARPAS